MLEMDGQRLCGTVVMLVASLLITGTTAGGPGDEDPELTGFEQQDASVVIVENSGPVWEQPWVIEESPLFRIGDLSGQPEYELYRVSGAVRLSDGRLVIGNSGTSELRWYSETGEFIRSAGGAGEGPGEFSLLSVIIPIGGDSIAVGDPRLRRLSI